MAHQFKSLACVALVALALALVCTSWAEAQKTSRNTFQQTVASGGNQQSVYGGYNGPNNNEQSFSASAGRQRQTNFVAPVNQQQRRTQQQQTYVSRQTARQPVVQQQDQQESYSSSSSSSYDQQAEADAEPASYGAVQGSPGQDFPNYARVPKTSFSCDGLPYDYGMYADEETGCQAYHVCFNGRKESFLCGPGTVFNQRILHCDYWYSVECGKSSQYYSSNAYMGSSQPEPGPAEANAAPARPVAQSSYQRNEYSASSSTSLNRPLAPSKFRNQQPQQQQQAASSFSRNTQQVQEAY